MKVFKKLPLPIAAIAAFAGNSHGMEKKSYKYFEQPDIKHSPIVTFNCNMVDENIKRILNRKNNHYSKLSLNQLPENVAAIINRYSQCTDETKILEEENLVLKKVKLENLGIGMSRIIGAQLINRCAKDHNLSIRAVEQKSYLDPDGALWIVAPKIIPSKRPFSLKQMRDLYKLAKLTGYGGDLHAANIFNTEEGNAFAIDTEEKSFLDFDISDSNVISLKRRFSTFIMEPAAQEWIDTKLKKFELKEAAANKESESDSNSASSNTVFKVQKATEYAQSESKKIAETKLIAERAANAARLAQIEESIKHKNEISKQQDSLKDTCGIS